MIYGYTSKEQTTRKALTEAKRSLEMRKVLLLNQMQLVEHQMQQIDRQQDAWMVETLFSKGISLSKACQATFTDVSVEVPDE